MADINSRPFARNYSGLLNQAVVGAGIVLLGVSWHEFAKRRRRGKRQQQGPGMGSVETWEFGYLYNGRSWARKSSPPSPNRWYPLAWIAQAISISEKEMNNLRGIDATFYCRFLRGCVWFALLHTCTTMPILLPIHISFAGAGYESKSMTRASISALVATSKGKSLLWIHICLLYWLTFTWVATVFWICRGAFHYRALNIEAEAARRNATVEVEKKEHHYHPHPHPQYAFQPMPSSTETQRSNRGLRFRTVMVTNIPPLLRSEKELRDYFTYYLSRHVQKPAIGLTSTTQPGLFNRFAAYLYNRAKLVSTRLWSWMFSWEDSAAPSESPDSPVDETKHDTPTIDRVVIARKMTELASLLARREDVLKRLETAHIKLAQKTLLAVMEAMEQKEAAAQPEHRSQIHLSSLARSGKAPQADVERGTSSPDGSVEGEGRMDLLIRTLGPFIEEFGLWDPSDSVFAKLSSSFRKERSIVEKPKQPDVDDESTRPTIWEALLSLPRSTLDAYQPLIHLNALFRGKTVPAIDYYTAKLNLLTALVTENRARAAQDFDPLATAFVSFAHPADARRACEYLTVHPENPLVCNVTMAPGYEDIDWGRVMKETYRAEFIKDWVVNAGVWAFTIFWLIPVTAILSLVSVSNIKAYWPALNTYLSTHPWEEEVIESFVPTLLVSLLALTIPLLLLLIAKKAHTILTLSALHDRIMIRYYKWLVLNVLVFFCVGTTALQSFLVKFRDTISIGSITTVVTQAFPSAGPFYVGWFIFTTGMHMGLEVALLGLPLIMYPSTSNQVTPRRRAVGIRPRTFNYYYWLPNHLVVVHITFVFAVLNPLVIPFALVYFAVDRVVIKNSLLHVYAKNYEQDGRHLMVRMVRYSFDGLVLSQTVFMAYMIALKKYPNVGLAALLIVFTTVMKLVLTRLYRAKYEEDDIALATAMCKSVPGDEANDDEPAERPDTPEFEPGSAELSEHHPAGLWTWKLAPRVNFSYASIPNRHQHGPPGRPNPFGPGHHAHGSFTRLSSLESPRAAYMAGNRQGSLSMPALPGPPTICEDAGSEGISVRDDYSTYSLVARHPPHPKWDDESSPDHIYDNPYYTQPIGNFLWLPRDPFGTLDLDDTIDMHASLTSEPGIGHIGPMPGVGETATNLHLSQYGGDGDSLAMSESIPFTSSPELEDTPVFPTAHTASPEQPTIALPCDVTPLTGGENIALAPTIAARIESGEKADEEAVSPAINRRASTIRRRPSTLKTARGQSSAEYFPTMTSKPSNLGLGPPPVARAPSLNVNSMGMRSFSSGSATSRMLDTYRRTSAYSTSSERRQRMRTLSAQPDEHGVRPEPHGRPSTTRSVLETERSRSRLSGTIGGHGATVSTHEAVVNEVIVEEAEAADERIRQEEEEVAKATQSKPWWQAWMFQRAEP